MKLALAAQKQRMIHLDRKWLKRARRWKRKLRVNEERNGMIGEVAMVLQKANRRKRKKERALLKMGH